MEKIKVFLDDGAIMPTKAHEVDAGYDLYIPYDLDAPFNFYRVGAKGFITIDTGVHMEIPRGYVGMIKSKSGLNVKGGIQCEGVVDCGYTGSIRVKAYNHGDDAYTFNMGDKITQIVIMPIPETKLIKVDSLDEFGKTERGSNGFGSTGR